ncbi:hypothetical protein HPB50_008609 [Hyalomma asiaticum]|uniref:Uncharacterized protein n=1 Tax=Hyalomma asiaticum TaxID=266040 RepID=A0ACB7RZ51_HYAAI|nr:hypothetical protein HPB50_008609 [Hyalomma asiaticum]
MSDEDDSDEAVKESVGFAWTSNACQLRIVVFLFVLSILLGILTAYIIIPRLREDCRKYHMRRMLSKNKRGLAIPARNQTSGGGSGKAPRVTSSDVTTVSNSIHGLASNASFSIEIRGVSVTTSPDGRTTTHLDDVAGDDIVLPIDFRPDNESDREDVVVIVGSDRSPAISTSTAGVTADYLSFINWTTSRELSTSVALEDIDVNVVQATATDAFRDETGTFGTDGSNENKDVEGNLATAWTGTFTAVLSTRNATATTSNVSSLDNYYLNDVSEAEVTSEYDPLSQARASDNADNVSIAKGLGAAAGENEQTSVADVPSRFNGTEASTLFGEFFETIPLSITAQAMPSSEQFSATTHVGDTATPSISKGQATTDDANGGSNVDTGAAVDGTGTATSDDRQDPLSSLPNYSTSHSSYSVNFKTRNSPDETDVPADTKRDSMAVISDITEDGNWRSHLISATNENTNGTITTAYDATVHEGTSGGTAGDRSENNVADLQQDLKSTITDKDNALYNDTGGLNRSLTTQESRPHVSESEASRIESAEAATKVVPDHNTLSVMSDSSVLNFTKFDMHARNETDVPADTKRDSVAVISDITEDGNWRSHLISATNENTNGTITTAYDATVHEGTSGGTAGDRSENNVADLQQDLKSTITGKDDNAPYNDTGGLNRSLTTQESRPHVSESEASRIESAEAATKVVPDHNTLSVMSDSSVLNFTKFNMHARSKGYLENASEFCTHNDKAITETGSPSSSFGPTRISEMAPSKRSTFTFGDDLARGGGDNMAQYTQPESEYDDTTPYATVPSSITKLTDNKTPFATETDDDAEEETVSGAEFTATVRQARHGESDATDAEDYGDTMITEASPTSQRVITPETPTPTHSKDTKAQEDVDANDSDDGAREVQEALQGGLLSNPAHPRYPQRDKLRNIQPFQGISQDAFKFALRSNQRRYTAERRRAKHVKRTHAPQKAKVLSGWRETSR